MERRKSGEVLCLAAFGERGRGGFHPAARIRTTWKSFLPTCGRDRKGRGKHCEQPLNCRNPCYRPHLPRRIRLEIDTEKPQKNNASHANQPNSACPPDLAVAISRGHRALFDGR